MSKGSLPCLPVAVAMAIGPDEDEDDNDDEVDDDRAAAAEDIAVGGGMASVDCCRRASRGEVRP